LGTGSLPAALVFIHHDHRLPIHMIEWHYSLVWITTEGIDYVENNLF
jgi:hypothetical protein